MKRALVLAVEDEERYADVLNRCLKRENIDMILATSAGDAEEQLRTRRNAYDAIILDLGLDDSRGMDTFQRITIAMGERKVPVVVVTGGVDAATMRRLLHAGARDVLIKGEGEDRVVRAVQAAIRAAEPSRSTSPVPGGGISPDWINYMLQEGEERTRRIIKDELGDLISWASARKQEHDERRRDSIRPKRHIITRPSEWPATIRKVAEVALVVASAWGATRMAQSPAQPAQPQVIQFERQPRHTRAARPDQRDEREGQRGSDSVSASATADVDP